MYDNFFQVRAVSTRVPLGEYCSTIIESTRVPLLRYCSTHLMVLKSGTGVGGAAKRSVGKSKRTCFLLFF